MKAAKSHPPLSLNVNAIFDGRFVFAGTVLDQQTLATLPATFKKYIVPAESESDEAEQVVTNFQMNTPYGVDQNGRLRQRNVERQVSEQIRAAQFQEAMEEQLAHEIEHPDEATKVALEVVADRHQAQVGLEIAQQKFKAKQREMDEEAARQCVEEDPMLVDDNLNLPVSPTIHENQILKQPADWKPQPKRMRKRYVCRNNTWLRTKNLKRFRPGEAVFVRNGVNDFEQIGAVVYLED